MFSGKTKSQCFHLQYKFLLIFARPKWPKVTLSMACAPLGPAHSKQLVHGYHRSRLSGFADSLPQITGGQKGQRALLVLVASSYE